MASQAGPIGATGQVGAQPYQRPAKTFRQGRPEQGETEQSQRHQGRSPSP